MSWKYTIWFGLAIVTVCLTCRPLAAASIDDWIPADVALAVLSDDMAATAANWEQTRWGAALSGAMFAPLRQELRSRDVAAPLYLRPWFGVDWAELANWKAPAALIVFGDDKAAHAAWLFPVQPDREPLELTAGMNSYLTANRFTPSEKMLSGFRVVSFRPPEGSERADGPATLTNNQLFAIANSSAAAVQLASKLSSAEFKPLTALPEYRESTAGHAEPASGHSNRYWIRPLPLWRLARIGDKSKPQPDWLAIGQRQGFESVQSVSGLATYNHVGTSEIELHGKAVIAHPLTKAARILELETGPAMAIPDWLTTDFASLSLWQCDFSNAINSFGHIFDELSEPGPNGDGLFKDLLDGLRDDPEGPRVDLRREVFPNLGPQVLSIGDRSADRQASEQTAGTNSATSRSLLVIQCRNAPAVIKVLNRFYQADKEVRRQAINSDPLWTIGPGKSLFVEGGDSQVQIRAVMVTNDALLAASHPEIIFDHMREGKKGNSGLGQPLRLWTAWQNGVATDQTGYRGLIVEQPYLKNAYGQVRASGADAAEEWQVRWLRYLLLGSATSRSKVDRGALPPWSEVSSTLGVTGLNFDVSLADFVLRGGVLRQVPTTP